MTTTAAGDRLAIGSVAVGAAAGLLAFLGLPAFKRYGAAVMGGLGGVTPVEPAAPGLALALAVAFAVGLSMNFLPCNLPIVMSLLPATTGAESRGAFLRRTALYGAGAIAVLGTLGFVLGALGDAVRPFVLDYPAVGVYVAGLVIGGVGLLSVGWGLREVGVISLPSHSLPFMDALRNEVDRHTGASEYVLLGAVYGGTSGGCPMPTYHLLLVWVVVAADALFGAVLLGTYVVGRVLPVAVLGGLFRDRPTQVARLLGGRYGTLRAVNGVVLLAFGSLLVVFAGLRVVAGGA